MSIGNKESSKWYYCEGKRVTLFIDDKCYGDDLGGYYYYKLLYDYLILGILFNGLLYLFEGVSFNDSLLLAD